MSLSKSDIYDQLDDLVRNGANPASISNRDVRRALGSTGSLETINNHRKIWLAHKHPSSVVIQKVSGSSPALSSAEIASIRKLISLLPNIEEVIDEHDLRRDERRRKSRE